MREVHHFVGGQETVGTSGRFGDIYDPNIGEVQARVALATEDEVAAAVENARTAFPAWSATNPQRRARVLFEFKRLLETHMDELFDRLPEKVDNRRTRILQLAVIFRQMVVERPDETKAFLKWGVSFDPALRPAYLKFQDEILDRLVSVLPNNPSDPVQARAEARIIYGASNLFAAMAYDNFQPDEVTGFVTRIADLLSVSE